MQQNVERGLRIQRRGFVKSYGYKVFSHRLDRLPSMAIGSRVRFSGLFETGGTVRPKGKLLLIPFGHAKGGLARVGPKAFRRLVQRLIAQGNAYFRKVNGTLILFAENIAESDSSTRRFKREERKRRGVKSLKRGADIPIAVGVPQVQIARRTDVLGTVRRELPTIVAAIEAEIAKDVINGR